MFLEVDMHTQKFISIFLLSTEILLWFFGKLFKIQIIALEEFGLTVTLILLVEILDLYIQVV